MTDDTQAMPPMDADEAVADVSQLRQTLNELQLRTTTHSVHTAGGAVPKFDEWVTRWVADHIPTAMEKAQTYGSNSLARKGHRFAAARGDGGVSDKTALELGVAQYAVEKADRIEDAILRGQLPGRDSWVDLAVYALMAQYIRDHGIWG